MQSFFPNVLIMHHSAQTFTSWKAPWKCRPIFSYLQEKIKLDTLAWLHHTSWLGITSDVLRALIYNGLWAAIWIVFVLASSAFISFPNNCDAHKFSFYRTMQASLVITYILLFDSKSPLPLSNHLFCNLWHLASSWK